MTAITSLIIIATLSLLAVRTGSMALMMTGLSWDTASFQSYSAFFGVGFTTREAEMVVNHPVRRRIIRDLILVGNIGLTSALATLIATLLQTAESAHPLLILLYLVGGLGSLVFLSRVGWVQRLMDKIIQKTLAQAGVVRALDYELLLRIASGYCVSEIELTDQSPIVGVPLRESRPWDQQVVILALKRGGRLLEGIPNRDEILQAGDVVTAYGEEDSVRRLLQPHAPSGSTI
jgi:TrkA-C domain